MPDSTLTRPAGAAELVREQSSLAEIEDVWSALALERANAFLTPEWFHVWERHYGDAAAPMVGVARDSEGQVIGVLPLVLEGPTAHFAGSGLGDRFEPATPPTRELEVAAMIGQALRDERRTWSTLLFENVARDAEWWRELSRASGCGERPVVGKGSQLPAVQFGGRTWEEYRASRSRNLRSQIGRRRRALEAKHRVNVRWTTDPGEVGRDMELLFRLHRARWETRTQASSLASERVQAFHTDFALVAAERGWLRLAFLEVDDEPVAGWYGWRLGARYTYYQAGFEPNWADQSVGFVLFSETIRAAAEEGAEVYDMLLGDEPFKQRFADHEDAVCTVLIAPWWRPARAVARAEGAARRASKRLPDGLRERLKRVTRGARRLLPMARRR